MQDLKSNPRKHYITAGSMDSLLDLSASATPDNPDMLEDSHISSPIASRGIPGFKDDDPKDESSMISESFYENFLGLGRRTTEVFQDGPLRIDTQSRGTKSQQSRRAASARPKTAASLPIVFELDSKFLSKHRMVETLFMADFCNDINAECLTILIQNAETIFSWNTNNQERL
jgi:hypothetical protein